MEFVEEVARNNQSVAFRVNLHGYTLTNCVFHACEGESGTVAYRTPLWTTACLRFSKR